MATLTDIAEKTGFSMMTVSRCFNAPEKVKPETLEIVLKVAKECNYVPNTVARSLAKRETKIIYVYIPQGLDVSHPFVMQAVASIGEELGKYGYSFLMSRNFYSNESCDGVIAMGLTVDDEDEFIKISAKKPAIAFGNSSKFKNWVDVDNYRGSYLMAEYIFEKGYTNVLYVGIDNLENYSKQRLNGYCDCAKKYARELHVTTCDNTEYGGYRAVKQALGEIRDVQAVVCASDVLAMGAIRAIQRKKLTVPDDIAVTGFDGLGQETILYPAITTVAQPVATVGKLIAEKLIEELQTGHLIKKGIYVEPFLKINAST